MLLLLIVAVFFLFMFSKKAVPMRSTPRFATHENRDDAVRARLADIRHSTMRARDELRVLRDQLEELRERERVARKLAPPPQSAQSFPNVLQRDAYKTLRMSYDLASALQML